MSRTFKIVYLCVFSFFVCFLCIGYAKLTDQVGLIGNIEGKTQDDVFITEVNNRTANVSVTGFYDTIVIQNITLNANSDASYYVKLYNNNDLSKFIYDGYICENLPDGVKITIEEEINNALELNCVSSLIDIHNYDLFKITYSNSSTNNVVVESPIKLKYIELTTQLKFELNYNGNIYTKYGNINDDVVFDQIDIDLTDNTKNLVARCNNGGELGIINDKGQNYITLSNIKNYNQVDYGELDITTKLFDSLTDAVNYNSDIFYNDKSPNNFLVLQNINNAIESTSIPMEILSNRTYTINLNSKNVFIHKTILNNGKLRIYDNNAIKGLLSINDEDLLQNNLINARLIIDNVRLNLTDTISTVYSKTTEYKAVIVGCDGLVHIKNSDITTNYGFGIYKKSLYAGDILRTNTSDESKIIVENSSVISEYSNAVRFSDGAGIVSLVNSYISSCENMTPGSSNMTDPIFVKRHLSETTSDFDKYYKNSLTNIKIYITGGMLVCNDKEKVNHFYSDDKLNARVFYTKSAQFKTIADTTDNTIASRSNDNSFIYPVAMINGNGASNDDLFIDKENLELTDHYLNKDGWYYIYYTETDDLGNYLSKDYIDDSIYKNLKRNDKIIRVGDYFELINFNNPGAIYVNFDDYSGGTNYYIGVSDMKANQSQSDFMKIDYLFTFLASCDKYYFNIASLGNLNNVFHIENRGKGAEPETHNVGIKYITTSLNGEVSGTVAKDIKEHRFTLMKYNHTNTIDSTPPYVFVSQYESVLSYFIAKTAKIDANGNSMWNPDGTPNWDTSIRFADNYFIESGFQNVTVPGFLGNSAPYNYKFELYLLSNHTCPLYQRNGWYLWQDSVPKTITDIWNYFKYFNLMDLGNRGLIKNGDNQIHSDVNMYVSSQSTVASYGVTMQSNFTDSSGSNDYGYVRFDSANKIYGITINIGLPNTNTVTKPWLYIRSYGIDSGVRVRKDYPITANISYNKSPYIDTQDGIESYPYYVSITKTGENTSLDITIFFDAESTNYNLYSVALDPFDYASNNNNIVLKAIKIIGEQKSLSEDNIIIY